MAQSTYSYCYFHCPLQSLANQSSLGDFGGVVGVDHYWTKQGMPCVNGEPTEFANQDAFSKKWKAEFPQARVLEYRITDAVFYDPLVYNKLQSDLDFFVKFKNGSVCQTGVKAKTGQGPEYGNCKWAVTSAAFDWSQQRVRDWYLENIIQPTMKEGDGAWIDSDGPDNGAYECSGTHAYGSLKYPYPALNITSEIEAFCKGENAVVTAAQKYLIANKGYEYQCIDFYNQKQLPTSADSGIQCTSKLLKLNATVSNRVVALYGGRTGARWPSGGAYTERTAAQAVAVFLLTRQDHWLFVLPNADRIPPGVATLVLSDFGAPLGSMVRNGSVFSRRYEKKTVSLDCANFTAAFE
jgi:hypothetical protein